METRALVPGLTVAEVLARWPQLARVFIRYRMACPGCVMAPFDTLADVATAYHLSLECFLEELRRSAFTPLAG